MDANCAPSSANMSLHSQEAEFTLVDKKNLSCSLQLTFRYVDEVLFVDKFHFYSYVDSIYQSEIEIKGTTVFHNCLILSYLIEIVY
jgi:hypothetical protein